MSVPELTGPVYTAPPPPVVPEASRDTGFASQTRGTQPQWELDTQLSDLSADVYNHPGNPPEGWTRIDDATLANAGIVPTARDNADVALNDPESGFQAAVYTDGQGRVVVAYAGTDPASVQDWINNAQQGVGLNSEQYDQALQLAQAVVQEYGAQNVVFTGHSLGGGLASAASLATGSPAVTFNAAGVGPETLEQVGLSYAQAFQQASGGQIRRYNVENDVLTNAQQKTLQLPVVGGVDLPDALGYEITLENPNGAEDPIRAHLNGAVSDAMRSRDIKTEQNDNFFERLIEQNLFPMGPSASDIVETGADAARWTNDNVIQPVAGWTNENVIEPVTEFAVDAYQAGEEFAVDTYRAGEEFVGDVVDTGQEVVENLDPRNWNLGWP